MRKGSCCGPIWSTNSEFVFRDWRKPRKMWMWLRTACLLFSTRGFLNLERHIRLAAGSLNSYVQVLKPAKWNLGLGGTTQTTQVDSYFHTKCRTKGKFCFSQISDVLPLPILSLNFRHKYVAKFHSVWPMPRDSSYFTPCVCVCVCVPSRCHLGRWQTDGHPDCYPTHLASQTRTVLEVFNRPRDETGYWAINVDKGHFVSRLTNEITKKILYLAGSWFETWYLICKLQLFNCKITGIHYRLQWARPNVAGEFSILLFCTLGILGSNLGSKPTMLYLK